jgi:hypothetical protein
MSSDQIDRRLRSSIWIPLHRGVYRVAGSQVTLEMLAFAAVLAAGRDAIVSHDTAARLWRLEGSWASEIHVIVRRWCGRIPRLIAHQPKVFAPKEATRLGRLPITMCLRTLLDVAPSLSDTDLEDTLDDLLRRGAVAAQVVLSATRVRSGLPSMGRLAALAEERIGKPVSGSKKENRLRRLFDAAGLPQPRWQFVVRDADGSFVARPDFAYPAARLVIEFDGYSAHASRRQWERDRVRQNKIVALGWLPIRVTDRHLKAIPDDIVLIVRRRLTAFGAADRRPA